MLQLANTARTALLTTWSTRRSNIIHSSLLSKQLRFSPSMVCLHSALLIEPADCSFIATQWSSTMICCSHPLLHPEPGPQAQPRQFAWISLALLELIMLSTVLSSTFADLWPSQPFSELWLPPGRGGGGPPIDKCNPKLKVGKTEIRQKFLTLTTAQGKLIVFAVLNDTASSAPHR